jgi:hypothetical protein
MSENAEYWRDQAVQFAIAVKILCEDLNTAPAGELVYAAESVIAKAESERTQEAVERNAKADAEIATIEAEVAKLAKLRKMAG